MRRRNQPTEPARTPAPRSPRTSPPPRRPRPWKALVIGFGVLGLVYVGYQLFSSGDGEFQAAVAAVERRDFKQAGRLLDEYMKAHPDDRSARLLAAQAARQDGDTGRAERLLRELDARRSESDRVAFVRRLLALQSGNLADADRLFAACQADPDAADNRLMLEALIVGRQAALIPALFREMNGQGEMDAGEVDRARQAIALWLDHSTRAADRAQGLVWRGNLFGLTRDYPKAQADYRQALDLDPDQFEARQKLAGLLILEAPREAARHLEILHERDPANGDVTFALARVRRTLGRPAEAAALLDPLLEADPGSVPYLLERSRVAADTGDLGRAEELLRRLLAQAPGHPEANLLYSQVLELAGRPAEAKTYYDRYLEIGARQKKTDSRRAMP